MDIEQLPLFDDDEIVGTGKLLPWPAATSEAVAENSTDGEPQAEAA
ncbi:hypothetical protein ACWCPF_26205 [Streptomyces sp. NPDC001858]